jgi:hypothetical protein
VFFAAEACRAMLSDPVRSNIIEPGCLYSKVRCTKPAKRSRGVVNRLHEAADRTPGLFAYDKRRASCVRDFTPSLRNTLRR